MNVFIFTLYLREIKLKMKLFNLFAVSFFCFLFGYAQEGGTKPTTNNSNASLRLKKIVPAANTGRVTKKVTPTKEKKKSTTQLRQLNAVLSNFDSIQDASNTMIHQRNPTKEQQSKIDKYLEEMKSINLLTADFYLAKYKANNFNQDYLSDLELAQQLNPFNKEVILHLTGAYFIKDDHTKYKSMLKILKSIDYFNTDLMAYANDVVLGLEKNAILITHGEKDTYPILIALSEMNRNDVTIVNLDFLQSKAYREKLKKINLEIPNSELINARYLNELCNSNKSKNINLSLTIPKTYLIPVSSSLYINGLSFAYSKSKKDVFITNYNYYQMIKYSELLKSTGKTAKRLKANYLPLLLILKKGCAETKGYAAQLAEIQRLINFIIADTKKQKELNRAEGK